MKRILTRGDFLKVAGAAGAALLGGSGCAPGSGGRPELNVIVVILDSLRKDHVGAYGNTWIETPNLDSLAKESLLFTHAYPDALPTICARRAIHTGMRTFPFRDRPRAQESAPVRGWLPIPEEQPTLAEILQGQGYLTMLITDTYHEFMPPMNFHRGFEAYHFFRGQENDRYRDPSLVSEEEMERYLPVQPDEIRQYLANTQERNSEADWFAPKVFAEATEFLRLASKQQPFLLVVDCYDPHEPWDPPHHYTSLYDPDGYQGPEPFNPRYGTVDYLTERQLLRMRALYAAEVTMADRWLGRFLQRANELGLMHETLLLVISDHGHLLGEHGFVGKVHYALYPELTDIVMMVRHPEGKKAGEASDYYASTHDVTPTILGTLGMDSPSRMEGRDLCVLLEGKSPEARNHFTLGYGEHVWCRDEKYAMFGSDDGTQSKLFDLTADPAMNKDIAGDHPNIVKRMFDSYVLKDAGGPLPEY